MQNYELLITKEEMGKRKEKREKGERWQPLTAYFCILRVLCDLSG